MMELNLDRTLIWIVIFPKIRIYTPNLELGLIESAGLNQTLFYIWNKIIPSLFENFLTKEK